MESKFKKKIAFNFLLEHLDSLQPLVRPMFGCHAIYVDGVLVLTTRDKEKSDNDDGVWIATTREHHEGLRQLLPSMRSIGVLGQGETNWQIIPKDSSTFEEEVATVCDLIVKRDPRIGSASNQRKSRPRKTTRKR